MLRQQEHRESKKLNKLHLVSELRSQGYGKEMYEQVLWAEKQRRTRFIRGNLLSESAANIRSKYNTKFMIKDQNGIDPIRIINSSEAFKAINNKKPSSTYDVLTTTKIDQLVKKPEALKIKKRFEYTPENKRNPKIPRPSGEITSRKIYLKKYRRGKPVRRTWDHFNGYPDYRAITTASGNDGYFLTTPHSPKYFEKTLDRIIYSLNKTKNKKYLRMELKEPLKPREQAKLDILNSRKYQTKITKNNGSIVAEINARKVRRK